MPTTLRDVRFQRRRLLVPRDRADRPGREDDPLDRLAETVCLVLLAGMGLVQPAHKQEVGDLFDHLERVGNTARPKGIPDVIDLRSKLSS